MHRGELSQSDETLPNGEYADVYTFQGVAGGRARIELRSNAFDTYLFVVAPDGTQEGNDDASQGETTRSLVEMETSAGQYRVVATSFEPGETGSYQLTIDAGNRLGRRRLGVSAYLRRVWASGSAPAG